MFKQFTDKLDYPAIEKEILAFWQDNDIFHKSLEIRQNSPWFSFYDGPPTVNGKPGVHHLIARALKDMICRYKTMTGHYVRRQAGWDTHGLPVEIEVEKRLGLKQKSDIETIGIDKFNSACKDFVYSNIEASAGWRTFTDRMGYWVDLDDAYITCTNEYVESVWWALSQFFAKGLIYKGYKVIPQSPTIGTPLSTHELSLNYKEVKDANTYLQLKITASPLRELQDASILVWTTTPWTLFANVALAVGADITYLLVENTRQIQNEKVTTRVVLAESRLAILEGEYTVLKSFTGKEIIGTQYEKIWDYCPIDKEIYPNALTVLTGDFVTTEDGTGVVHIAPAFGVDDFEMSKQYKLPMLQPVTPNGHFTDEVGEFAGRAIKNFRYADREEQGADRDLVRALKEKGKIYKNAFDYLHKYPHCWRTDNPVMYYARDSWFIKSPEYRDDMVALNKTITWQPPEIGSGRFGNWLDEVKDWSLSRDRYWGTPLPIWVSEDGKDMFAVGSIAELMEGEYEVREGIFVPVSESGVEIDLHRPFVDRVVFRKNGTIYRRVHEVIDVWFDSGCVPFAQMHYPFENKEMFEKSFPADFIAEGIDQTRGWFYTLHNIATAVFGKPAYKGIIVNELVLDKKGQKMSKSKGNAVNPFELMDEYGADAARWYFMTNNPPWRPTLFNIDDLKTTVIADFFRTLTQSYNFFALYANIDEFTGNEDNIPVQERPEIDRWILSKLHTVIAEYRSWMEQFDVFRATRLLQDFVRDEVSNWFVRRNRRRFWKGERDNDKLAAYQTLHNVLLEICYLTAPTIPYLSEELYRNLRTDSMPESVHLCDMSVSDNTLIDRDLERRMAHAQTIVFLARSLREKAKIKTRQPLRRILIPVLNPQQRRDIQLVADIILEELNIKSVEYISDDSGIVKRSVKPNFKTLGKKFGKETQMIANEIKTIHSAAMKALLQGENITFSINGQEYDISPEDVDIISEDIEGWLVASQGVVTVALDTEIDAALLAEGFAREFVSKVQNARKQAGFNVTDRIVLSIVCDDDTWQILSTSIEYITTETLAYSMVREESSSDNSLTFEIDEKNISITLLIHTP